MRHTVLTECPFCKATMEIETASGKIVKKWPAQKNDVKPSERFSEALKNLEEQQKQRQNLFERSKQQLEKRKQKADETFKERLKEVKESGDSTPNPPRPIDL